MSTKAEVETFLEGFKQKMRIWDVLFRDDRGKNLQTLLELEIRPIERKLILEQLEVEDYAEGPLNDDLYLGSQMWVFGRMVRKKEVYIKITMGVAGSATICISFHIAEFKMSYPFKQ